MSKVAVLGAGAWGTALALSALRAGSRVTLWARSNAAETAASRATPRLPGVALPPELAITGDMAQALEGADITILAVPVQHLRGALADVAPRPALIASKGVEATSRLFPTEFLGWPALGIVSGPNFAHEIAAGLPAAAVIASEDAALIEAAIAALAGPRLRLYASADVMGVQAGGAAKNVLGIAAGCATGAGFGENARAALITRGLAELSRLVLALGGRAETAAGLSGLGDLMLTASSPSSRNTALGMRLGEGLSLDEALSRSRGVAEGVATAPALLARAAALGVEMPICAAVAEILSGRLTVPAAMEALLARPFRTE
ncbi:NAD(P)-dependent glycerol-3-phosphate dehydrogenase [Rhodovarius crocodyli]|uniref:Glycerol-3-phosphate dehydrogenase [NAD(P)+] n=1 Tax=Rhodovarius crocodyli TaxID=1979269 RepID=A0A437MMB1_9PROT|nr:NAD(P)H-dependent glycerol-3-phosphate dehydrogenase [Rhodovarius crocodyli]RVT98769.1 NAD(P)-dependent glycerol-3-phosphate dehydrogenase [Rhodovarius crocodyli]